MITKTIPTNSYFSYFTGFHVFRNSKKYQCPDCGRRYTHFGSLNQHKKFECGKEPQFKCPYCMYCAKRKCNLNAHTAIKHADKLI